MKKRDKHLGAGNCCVSHLCSNKNACIKSKITLKTNILPTINNKIKLIISKILFSSSHSRMYFLQLNI